jgi:hypothetical protein
VRQSAKGHPLGRPGRIERLFGVEGRIVVQCDLVVVWANRYPGYPACLIQPTRFMRLNYYSE